jgi:hypothetical protein
VLTRVHNGTCSAEIARVVREHPGEAECVSDGRVLGVMAPFRCKCCGVMAQRLLIGAQRHRRHTLQATAHLHSEDLVQSSPRLP